MINLHEEKDVLTPKYPFLSLQTGYSVHNSLIIK
ncbi:Uncharacterised protein [Serratia odorifera]|uniref:Uncharacterized protein n=1 Tax=Serratia odorifera TaxID=618 RepID=A0A3S4EYV0_SEROD|nr:Uncharacterised protein [Serratia odorifera]